MDEKRSLSDLIKERILAAADKLPTYDAKTLFVAPGTYFTRLFNELEPLPEEYLKEYRAELEKVHPELCREACDDYYLRYIRGHLNAEGEWTDPAFVQWLNHKIEDIHKLLFTVDGDYAPWLKPVLAKKGLVLSFEQLDKIAIGIVLSEFDGEILESRNEEHINIDAKRVQTIIIENFKKTNTLIQREWLLSVLSTQDRNECEHFFKAFTNHMRKTLIDAYLSLVIIAPLATAPANADFLNELNLYILILNSLSKDYCYSRQPSTRLPRSFPELSQSCQVYLESCEQDERMNLSRKGKTAGFDQQQLRQSTNMPFFPVAAQSHHYRKSHSQELDLADEDSLDIDNQQFMSITIGIVFASFTAVALFSFLFSSPVSAAILFICTTLGITAGVANTVTAIALYALVITGTVLSFLLGYALLQDHDKPYTFAMDDSSEKVALPLLDTKFTSLPTDISTHNDVIHSADDESPIFAPGTH